MVVWKADWKGLFMVQNVQYSNGPPSHMITIWILDTHTVWNSDESCIQVFSIQIVTVYFIKIELLLCQNAKQKS